MKVTTETVRRVAAHAERLTGGVHGLAFVAKPGDPLRYVDKHPGGNIFTGRDASRRATAFYAGIVDADPAPNPPLVDRVLLEVTQRHAAEVDAGRRARQATGETSPPAPHPAKEGTAQPMKKRFNYGESEMRKVLGPDSEGEEGYFRVKVTSLAGETRWLSITTDQAQRIAKILAEEAQ